jgi:hypothetical protein
MDKQCEIWYTDIKSTLDKVNSKFNRSTWAGERRIMLATKNRVAWRLLVDDLLYSLILNKSCPNTVRSFIASNE